MDKAARVAEAVAAINEFDRLKEADFERIADRHGVDPDDDDLIEQLINYGWMYAPGLDSDDFAYLRG